MTPNERSSQKDDRKMGGNSGQRSGDTRSQQQGKPATNKAPDTKSGAASSGRGNQKDENRGSSPKR